MDRHIRGTMVRRAAAMLSAIVLLIALMPALPAHAEDGGTTVRIGWHEVPYYIKDQNGRCSGYTYEYQCKVAAYTGWDYEYVEGSYSELLQKLMDGEIDMLGNVSYLDERAEKILYSSVPMGTESYYIFVPIDDTDISADDFSTLNGKKVGVAKGTFQKEEFLEWEAKHGVEAELIEMTGTEEESILKLGNELDAFVTMDVYADPEVMTPVCKIGSSDFYFAVSKDRPDLLAGLDSAMNRIQDENKYFNQQLHDKYLAKGNADAYLSTSEIDWLNAHGTIRVGYQDNYLAFCAQDPSTGELTGALKDYLEYAENSMENAHIDIEAVAFPTAAAAMEAMEKGEIDCVFPANLTAYDSETLGVDMTPALMTTEMDAVVRASEQKEFFRKEDVIVAVNEGNTNYDLFMAEHYPDWQRAYFKDTPAGLEAVAAGDADCVIISNYRYNNISKQCESLHLTTVYTGVDMDYCFAVSKGSTELYSILSRVTNAVPESYVHTSLMYYSTEDVKTSFTDLIKDNLVAVLISIAIILLIFTILLLRSIRMERKAIEEEQIVDDLKDRVFVDALTSVRNKGAYNEYMNELQDALDSGELKEFAVGVFDCDDLKQINDSHGHDKGDIYLKAASDLICRVFSHSPVFRIGGDEFTVILMNEDFRNRDELVREFESRRREICGNAEHNWDEVHVALGIAVYDPDRDRTAGDTVRRADKIMYDNKRSGKEEERG